MRKIAGILALVLLSTGCSNPFKGIAESKDPKMIEAMKKKAASLSCPPGHWLGGDPAIGCQPCDPPPLHIDNRYYGGCFGTGNLKVILNEKTHHCTVLVDDRKLAKVGPYDRIKLYGKQSRTCMGMAQQACMGEQIVEAVRMRHPECEVAEQQEKLRKDATQPPRTVNPKLIPPEKPPSPRLRKESAIPSCRPGFKAYPVYLLPNGKPVIDCTNRPLRDVPAHPAGRA